MKKTVLIAQIVLITFALLAIGAGWLAPYAYDDERRDLSYAPPSKVHVWHEGRLVAPFVYGVVMRFDANRMRVYTEDPAHRYPLEFFQQGRLITVETPGRLYWLGADSRGRDLFSRICYGARISLSAALLGVLIAFTIGLLVGGIAGYFGGLADTILMRICEMFMLVPGFYLMLALRAGIGDRFDSTQVYFMVVMILSFIGWAGLARVIRGMCLSLREREYVLAARILGLSHLQIVVRHILPHTLSYSLAAIMLSIPAYILGEAGLSFLGLGIQDPMPSWGNLLSEAMGIMPIVLAPWILIPGVLIGVAVLCFNIVGDELQNKMIR